MSVLIKDEKVLEKCKSIGDKISNSMQKGFDKNLNKKNFTTDFYDNKGKEKHPK